MKLGHVRKSLLIRDDLYEQRVFRFPRQMNDKSQGVFHYRQIREDAIAAHQYVALTSDKFHWAKRLYELFQPRIKLDKLRRPIPQHFRTFARTASMTLILLRKLTLALWTRPHRPNAAAKAQSEAGVAFAPSAKGMTALLCRSWALC
jgi:hypothetical protein